MGNIRERKELKKGRTLNSRRKGGGKVLKNLLKEILTLRIVTCVMFILFYVIF